MCVYYVTKGEETERITQDEKYLWCLKMNNLQQTPRKSRPLVTITPYNEQEKRVINGTIANGSSPPPPPPAPPLPLPSKSRHNSDDSVEMQSIDSFKLKDTPNTTIPKPPPIYFPVANAQTVSTTISANESPRHTVQIGNKSQVPQPVPQQINGNRDKPRSMAQELSPKTAVSPTKSTVVGKVAIRIGAYEGETKQPSKLDFLSQQPRSPTFVDGKNGYDDQLANGPVVSRLQNELAATLQRSNLRKKTETDNGSGVQGNSENSMMSNCEDTTTPEIGKLPQSSLDKLASALGNKVTIKVSPENGNR